jgi:hypothetical protein
MGEIKESVPFFKSIWLALNPWRYDELKDRGTGMVLKYFFSFIFLAFILAVIVMLPAISGIVSRSMGHFDTLAVSFNTSMNSAAVFPEKSPYITLDTRTSEGKLKEGRFLITDDYLYWKQYITGEVNREPLGQYKNLLANEGLVVALVVLMAPSLLFLFYILYAIKVFLIVVLATILCFVITRLARFDVPFLESLKVAMMSATPMIIIDLVRLPLGLNVYYAQYIAFLIFFIAGTIKAGEFEERKGRGKHRGKGGYIDLTRGV